MIKQKIIVAGLLLTAFAACRSKTGSTGDDENYMAPEAGTVVTQAVTETDDELNHFKFSVFVKAGAMSDKGMYDVLAVYGHDSASGGFTMPQGGEHLKPLIRQSDEPATFIVGFHYGGDTAFYDYYKVSGSRGTISMQYVKAYSFK
jgi:hypothetical protein